MMALIKTVTNGSNSATFKAVSLGHVVAIVFGLVSLLGAQQTWLLAAANERREIVREIQTGHDREAALHRESDARSFAEINRRLAEVELHIHAMERQVAINTGRLDRMR